MGIRFGGFSAASAGGCGCCGGHPCDVCVIGSETVTLSWTIDPLSPACSSGFCLPGGGPPSLPPNGSTTLTWDGGAFSNTACVPTCCPNAPPTNPWYDAVLSCSPDPISGLFVWSLGFARLGVVVCNLSGADAVTYSCDPVLIVWTTGGVCPVNGTSTLTISP